MLLRAWSAVYLTIGLITAIGCSTTSPLGSVRRHPSDAILSLRRVATHSEREVLTRQWLTPSGENITLLDFRVEQMRDPPELAIAKYGNKLTERVWCVDVYEYRPTLDATNAALFLLCHDNREGELVDLQVEREEGEVIFVFTREFTSVESSHLIRNTYSYRYTRETGVARTTEDIYQEVATDRANRPKGPQEGRQACAAGSMYAD